MGLEILLHYFENKFPIINDIKNIMCKYLNYLILKNNYIYIYINRLDIKNIMLFFVNSSFFKLNYLNDMTIVDYPDKLKRFKIIYILSSESYMNKIVFIIFSKLFQKIMSLHFIFNSLKWLEREAWDMFGVNFFNNNDLRRILTDYNFKNYPLRKDFPLSGFFELSYSEKYALPIYKKIELMQELRFFVLQTDWEEWDTN